MMNLKETLLSKEGFINNEFIDKYCFLIERNTRNYKVGGKTNSHHVVPRSWFKLHNQPVDNSLSNLVNLDYRDHVMAHYYLCLCTSDQLQYANELGFMCLISRKKLNYMYKLLVSSLPLYNIIYESYKNHHQTGYKLYEDKQ